MKIKFTKFEAEEIRYKIEVLIDSGEEMWESILMSEDDLENLNKKINSGIVELTEKEVKLIKEESENLLDIALSNLEAGFDEYKKDVAKLKKLFAKFS